MTKLLRNILLLIAIMAVPGQLTAQLPPADQLNRLWNRETIFPTDGFIVKDRLQNPVFGITAGVVPGPMPVVVQLQIDGSVKSWAREGQYWRSNFPNDPLMAHIASSMDSIVPILPGDPTGQWITEGQEVFRPIYGTIHFGYTLPASYYGPIKENEVTVLEDGTVLDSLVPITKIGPNQNLALFDVFKLSSVSSSKIQLSSDGQYATWLTSLSSIGDDWKTKIQSAEVAPTGFITYTMLADQQYKVIIDRHKARAFQYLSNFNMYVPVMWRDRAGNTVTFKWEKKTADIPSGATEMVCLTVKNDQDKGVQIQWITYPDTETEKDLVRVDFINMNAPSMHIKGYPGINSQLPPPLTNALLAAYPEGIGQTMPIRPKTGGPIMRPTQVALTGNRNLLTSLPNAWNPLPVPSAVENAQKSAKRTWELTYNTGKNQIYKYKDPKGLETMFAYSEGSTPYPFGELSAITLNKDVISRGINHPIKFMRVASVSTTNSSLTNSQTWAWDQSAKKVTHTGTFNGASLTTVTGYSSTKPMDIANSVWKERKTYNGATASGDLLESLTNTNTASVGLDSSLTIVSSQSVTKKDEPAYTITTSTDANTFGLRIIQTTIKDSPNASSEAQSITYTYTASSWKDLSPGDLLTTTATSYGKAPSLVQKNTWSGINIAKSYIANGNAQWGTNYTYDTAGRLETSQPYLLEGGTTTYGPKQTISYDTTNKQPNKSVAADGTSTYTSQITAFDTNNLPTTTIDQLGITTNTTYDDRGRIVSQTRVGVTTTYTYPTELKVQTSTKPDTGGGTPITATQEYDAFGRLTKTTNSAGITTTYTYQGRETTINTNTNGVSMTQSHTVDALGRPIISQSADGALATYEYITTGTAGQYKVKTTRTQGMATITTEEVRNLLGQTLEVKEIDGPRGGTLYTYNGLGNLTALTTTNQSSQTRTFQYDSFGRLISRTEPETGITTFANYEVNGQPKTITEQIQTSPATNRVRTITYDGFGRITNIASGGDTLTYAYQKYKPLLDKATRGQTTGTVTQDYLYNAYAQVTKETTTDPNFIANIQYEYDTWGDINRITYPGADTNTSGRIISYEYDTLRQINAIKHGAASLATLTYDPLGRKKITKFESGAQNTYTYSPVTRIDKWEIKPLGQSAIERKFEYDTYGYLKNTGEWIITNDTLGRIQEATGHGVTTTHGHDNFGNNISHSVTPAQTKMINWSFPPLTNNRIPAQTQNGAQTWWQYSENGEAAFIGKAPGGDKLQMAWDGLGLLKAVSDNGNSHNFTYAPSGLRVRDQRTGTNPHDKRYVYTTSGALMTAYETIGSTTKRRDVVYANGEAIAEIDQNNNIYELHNDHLGTPRYITSRSNGQIAGQQAFGPYGEEMVGTFNGQKLPDGYKPLTGYTGHLNEDMTGLIYMKGRYYSPLWHRFINSDQGVDPNSINQFAYVGGRPFMATDPSGMRSCVTFTMAVPDSSYDDSYSNGTVVLAYKLIEIEFCYGGRSGGVEDMPSGGVGGGGGGGGIERPARDLKTKDIDKAACDAYNALVKKYGAIPTGQTEAGAKLYYDNGKVRFSDFISHTAKPGQPLTVNLGNLTGAVGTIHTHPSTQTQYVNNNNKLAPITTPSMSAWLNVSESDHDTLGYPMKAIQGIYHGYLTTPEFWKNHQIIRYTSDDNRNPTYDLIRCR